MESLMKLILIVGLCLLTQWSFAREEYQLGVEVGTQAGISGKLELGKNRAMDGLLAYSLAHDLELEFHSDYLIENQHSFNINAPSPLELYLGIGARFAKIGRGRHEGEIVIGPRAPVGVMYKMSNPNLEFFGEIALAFDIIPYTNLDLEAGLGVRYRF